MTGSGGSSESHYVKVSAPGRYRVRFPTLDGYLPVPEREVVVEDGKMTEITIRLERAR
jgi:hypothetical protein